MKMNFIVFVDYGNKETYFDFFKMSQESFNLLFKEVQDGVARKVYFPDRRD